MMRIIFTATPQGIFTTTPPEIITTTPPPPYPKEGYLPSPKPPPDIGRGLNRSYSSLIH